MTTANTTRTTLQPTRLLPLPLLSQLEVFRSIHPQNLLYHAQSVILGPTRSPHGQSSHPCPMSRRYLTGFPRKIATSKTKPSLQRQLLQHQNQSRLRSAIQAFKAIHRGFSGSSNSIMSLGLIPPAKTDPHQIPRSKYLNIRWSRCVDIHQVNVNHPLTRLQQQHGMKGTWKTHR